MVVEGDVGDAFYVIVEGRCAVSIGGSVIAELLSGHSFGEKALENNARRSATVTSVVPTKLMVLLANEYRQIIVCAQAHSNESRAHFLAMHCHPMKVFSYPRIKSLVREPLCPR